MKTYEWKNLRMKTYEWKYPGELYNERRTNHIKPTNKWKKQGKALPKKSHTRNHKLCAQSSLHAFDCLTLASIQVPSTFTSLHLPLTLAVVPSILQQSSAARDFVCLMHSRVVEKVHGPLRKMERRFSIMVLPGTWSTRVYAGLCQRWEVVSTGVHILPGTWSTSVYAGVRDCYLPAGTLKFLI
jgi:hypothetical protein